MSASCGEDKEQAEVHSGKVAGKVCVGVLSDIKVMEIRQWKGQQRGGQIQ